MRIKFGEPQIYPETYQYISQVLNSNWVSMGGVVARVEELWCRTFGCKYAIYVSSGTDALAASLSTLYETGAKRGDGIIVPALSFIATANAVRMAGFTPIFVDVKSHDMLIDEDLIEDAIVKYEDSVNIVGIVPVTLMGQVPQMGKIKKIAERYKLSIIIDDAEGLYSTFRDKQMFDWGIASTTSMYAAHLVFGVEGGMVMTNSLGVSNLVKSIRSHGRQPNSLYFDHERQGFNFKPTDVHACFALASIAHFDEIYDKRRMNLAALCTHKLWQDLGDAVNVTGLYSSDDGVTSPHAFSVTCRDGKIDLLKSKLNEAGIEFKRNFGSMPRHGAFKDHFQHEQPFPNAEFHGDNGIHVPVHQNLSPNDIQLIKSTFEAVWR